VTKPTVYTLQTDQIELGIQKFTFDSQVDFDKKQEYIVEEILSSEKTYIEFKDQIDPLPYIPPYKSCVPEKK